MAVIKTFRLLAATVLVGMTTSSAQQSCETLAPPTITVVNPPLEIPQSGAPIRVQVDASTSTRDFLVHVKAFPVEFAIKGSRVSVPASTFATFDATVYPTANANIYAYTQVYIDVKWESRSPFYCTGDSVSFDSTYLPQP